MNINKLETAHGALFAYRYSPTERFSIIRLPLSLYFPISDRNEVFNTRNPALRLLVYQWAQYQDCEERERSFQWEFTSDLPHINTLVHHPSVTYNRFNIFFEISLQRGIKMKDMITTHN